MKKVLVILFCIAWLLTYMEAEAQNGSKAHRYFEKARNLYLANQFKKALHTVDKAIKNYPKYTEAYLLKAEISEELNDTANAIHNYEKVLSLDSTGFPSVYYYLGELLYKKGDYEKSAQILEIHLNKFKNVSNTKRILHLFESASFAAKAVKSAWDIDVIRVSGNINTQNAEYINFVNEDKTVLYFTRKEPLKTESIDGRNFIERIFYSEYKNDEWQPPIELTFPWQNNSNLGAVTFSVDSRTLIFTGCYFPEGVGSCDIYFSRKAGDNWLMPYNAGLNINSSGWDSQAVLSSNGKMLFFSSKRGNGNGGSDIWYSKRDKNGNWSKPVNAGNTVNTSYDEMSPFLSADNKTLYFSSNGHPGLGGFDLFVARIDTTGTWNNVTNLGVPVNSAQNEINIFISLDGQTAWISSDRGNKKKNFDIFFMTIPEAVAPEKTFYFKGVTLSAKDHKPLWADVILTDLQTGKTLDSTRSDAVNGRFLAVIHPGINYAVNIYKRGYMFLSENLNLENSYQQSNIYDTFYLQPIDSGSITNLYNINFDFDKADLKPTSLPELKRLIKFLNDNPEVKIEISGHTDRKGSGKYNLILSEKRAKSVFLYLINNGINENRLTYKGYGYLQPICTDTTDECAAKNRRTEIKILGK